MAVVWGIRIAIALAGIGTRYVVSGGSTPTTPVINAITQWFRDLHDAAVSASDLTERLTLSAGEEVTVADITGTFELRKLAWRISRAPSGGTVEDQDVLTFHFLKMSGGTPAAWVDGTDLPTLEGYVGTFWGSIKSFYPSWYHSDQYRWYKDGPAFYELRETPAPARYVPLASGNPAVRVTEVDVAGTSANPNTLPPQVAMSITEKCSARPHWGRFYLPAPDTVQCDANGRIPNSDITTILGAAVTLYNAARAANYVPVVWSIQKPERLKKNGATLPAQDAIAFEVTSLQMDNLFDVVRRRRWAAATIRTNTVLT